MDVKKPAFCVPSFKKSPNFSRHPEHGERGPEDVKQQTQQINAVCAFIIQHNVFLYLTATKQIYLLRALFIDKKMHARSKKTIAKLLKKRKAKAAQKNKQHMLQTKLGPYSPRFFGTVTTPVKHSVNENNNMLHSSYSPMKG